MLSEQIVLLLMFIVPLESFTIVGNSEGRYIKILPIESRSEFRTMETHRCRSFPYVCRTSVDNKRPLCASKPGANKTKRLDYKCNGITKKKCSKDTAKSFR